MYKFLLVFIILLVILIIALNMGVFIPLKTEPELSDSEVDTDVKEGFGNQKRIIRINYSTGSRIDGIEFVFSDGSRVGYGGQGGFKRKPIDLDKDEYIYQVMAYDNVCSYSWQYRGGKIIFVTNKREILLTTNIKNGGNDPSGYSNPNEGRGEANETPAHVKATAQLYNNVFPKVANKNRAIVGIKWTATLDGCSLPTNATPATLTTVHAWMYDVETVDATFKLDERLYKELFKKISEETQFKFNLVETTKDGKQYDNILATAQFYDNVHNIQLYDAIQTGQLNTGNNQYVKLLLFIKSVMANGVKSHQELVDLLSNTRQQSSTQGFTTIEGLTNDGRLTDAEAVCYLNRNESVRNTVGSGLIVPVTDKDGLQFKIYNGYFGMSSKDGKPQGTLHTKWRGGVDNSNPYFNGEERKILSNGNENEWQTLHNQLDSVLPCDQQTITEWQTKGWGKGNWVGNTWADGVDADKRQGLGFCSLAQGRTINTTNIQAATTDMDTGKQYVPNGIPAEYYTFIISGYFKPDATGVWDFYVHGDDGVYLEMYTDDGFRRIAAVPGLHGVVSSTGNAKLTKDKMYWFKFVGGENWGADIFSLQFKCNDSPGNARNWTGYGKGYYFTDNKSLTATNTLSPQETYPLNVIQDAKLHWENNGKPNTYECIPGTKDTLTPADSINWQIRNYSDYSSANSDIIKTVQRSYDQWIESGRSNAYSVDSLPKVEPFVEGLQIEEPSIDKYLKEMGDLGVTPQGFPTALKTFKQTYGVDISKPDRVSTFFTPLKEFGIRNFDDLEVFKATFAADNTGFIDVSQYGDFILYMSQFGLKYKSKGFQKFIDEIRSFRVSSFGRLKDFHKQLESIGFGGRESNPVATISKLREFGVDNYNEIPNFIKTMKNYAGKNASNVPSYIDSLISFNVKYPYFNDFLTNSANVSSELLIEYINAFSTFGLKYLDEKGSTANYRQFISMFLLPWPIPNVTDIAQKYIDVINIYKRMGFTSNSDLISTTVQKGSQVNGNNRIVLHNITQDKTVMGFLGINMDTNLGDMKSRLNQVIDDIYGVLGNSVCDFTRFLTILYNSKQLKHDSFKDFIKQNQALFKAELSDFISCGNNQPVNSTIGQRRPQESFTTIREGLGFDTGSKIFNSSVPFGIGNYASAVLDPATNAYIGISNFNQILSSFEVDSVPKYKVFLDKMKNFGVSPENVLKYTDKLKMFRIKYSNYVPFTVYIDAIGVKYSGFDAFIEAIMSLGVFADDFIPFLCHIYSFGVTYDASPDSMFFRFIGKMRDYGIMYIPAEDGGNKFINAIKNFIFYLSYGIESLECSLPQIDVMSSVETQENQLKGDAKNMVAKGEGIVTKNNYARYFFDFTPTPQDPITVPLTQIIDTCKSMDPAIRDIVNLNPYVRMKQIGFVSDAVTTVNGGFSLNQPDENKVIPYPDTFKKSYRAFMYFFAQTNAVSEIKSRLKREFGDLQIYSLDVPLVTTFMEDTDGKLEYKNIRNKGIISVSSLQTITNRMEVFNKSNHGNYQKRSVYATYNVSINTIRLFPYFSAEYIKYFFKNSPYMTYSMAHPNAAQNPDNTRCTPYIKVKYDVQDCSETFTEYNSSGKLIFDSNSTLPVQIGGKQTTIQSTQYGTWDPRNTFSAANW